MKKKSHSQETLKKPAYSLFSKIFVIYAIRFKAQCYLCHTFQSTTTLF